MDKIEKLAQARENLVDDIELRHNNRLNIVLLKVYSATLLVNGFTKD